MARALLRLAGLIERRRFAVVGMWLVVVAAAVPFALRQSEDLTGSGFDVPGSGSAVVDRAIATDFPAIGRAQLAVVLVTGPGGAREAVDALPGRLAGIAGVAISGPPATRGGVAVVPLRIAAGEDRAPDVASAIRERLGAGEDRDGVTAHVIGLGAYVDATGDVLEEDLRTAEAIGFPIVLIILLAAFGSLVAAALPLVLGLVSVTVTGALIFAVSQTMDVYLFATNIASLVGIGVAVDYSLFVVVRFREELAAGRGLAAARATALATSGLAVMFSGATVIVSLLSLWTVDSSALRSLALGAILVVAVSVLGAVTLLPALLAIAGRRAGRRRGARHSGFWERWTTRVTGRPVLALVAGSAVIGLLAAPAVDLDIRSGILDQLPSDNETRVGFAAAASVAGPGAAGRAYVLYRGPGAEAAAARGASLIRADPAMAAVAPPVMTDGAALVAATPAAPPESPGAKALIDRLRDRLPAAAGDQIRVDIGGVSAAQLDYERQISGGMGRILLFVLVISYVVLVFLLRSLVVPLKAVVMTLLSVAAAYGVITVAFQWLGGPGHVDPTVPPILLALVFGLSMDYEVFLLSRIRERYLATGDTRRAVAEGLAASAGPVTSAAAIMVGVFAVFLATGIPAIRMMALGGAVAVALDATLVRLVLVPATMTLLGDRNWWLPGWLDRILPASADAPLHQPVQDDAADGERRDAAGKRV